MTELAPGWVYAHADEIAASTPNALAIGPFGSNLKVSDYRDAGVPLVFVRNIRAKAFDIADLRFVSAVKANTLRSHRVQQGDLLITKMGDPPGDATIYPLAEEGIITADCVKLTPHSSIDARYLMYAVGSPAVKRQILQITRGVAQPKMSLDRFRNFVKIPLAPHAEQERIVAAIEQQISRLDVGVAVLEKVRRDLERMRSASFLQMHDNAMLGSVPRPAKEACEFIVDGDHNPPKRTDEGIPYLTAKHVKRGRISTYCATRISHEDFDLLRRRYYPRQGDVLVTCVGTLGEVAIVPDGLIFAADRNLAAMRPRPAVMPTFLEAILRSPRLQKILTSGSGSTAQPHIYLRDLRQLPIPVPALDVQESLVITLHEQLAIADQLEADVNAALARCGRLRVSILAAAFSGRLVPQDSDDEPASALLQRIASEKRASSNGHGNGRGRRARVLREEVTA